MPPDRTRQGSLPNPVLPWAARIVALATGLGASVASLASGCEVREWTQQSARVVCMIAGDADARFVRVEARFGGFHDDSLIGMTSHLDDVKVPCEPYDRIELSGESGSEGDVSLFCRFRVPPSSGRNPVLVAVLRFRHAEFVQVRLLPD